MVSKCANPACNTLFLYFHQGKLFRRESAAGSHRAKGNGSKKPLRHLEFFWLCNECAETMTVAFEEDADILVRPRVLAHSRAA